jgi:hypothetical protein
LGEAEKSSARTLGSAGNAHPFGSQKW